MDFIEIKLRKFESLVKRNDIKSPQWFAMPNDILEHPDFFDITGDEFKVFTWICGLAAKLNDQKIRIYPDLCARRINISKKAIAVTIEKLNKKRWDVTCDVTDVLRIADAHVTLQYSTEQDSTVQYKTVQGLTKGFHPLVGLWNEHRGNLPEIKKVGASRLKAIAMVWKELSEDEWVTAIKNVAESNFCNGQNERAWVATFAWLLGKDKSKNLNCLKAFEGNYENRIPKTKPEALFKNAANVAWANTLEGEK